MRSNLLFSTLLAAICSLAACGSSGVNVNVNANTALNANDPSEPAGTPSAASAEAQTSAAKTVVSDLYKQHDAHKGPFFQTKDRRLVDKFFTKPLADLIWKDATTSAGEVGAIDGDPLYDAQDMEIKNFAIGEAATKAETATVPVTFENFGKKVMVTFVLKQENNIWKIDDIKYARGDSLMKWLKDTYPAGAAKVSPADGTFDGRYQVGQTTCTVEPVKMSYAVRWAKGKGVENFVYKNETTFESATDEGNQFVFDDGNYNSGTFYRSDGKTFAIKRLK
jgi:hypothetical protein